MKFFLRIYDALWLFLIPFLRFSKRLQEGFECRILQKVEFGKVDIWMHAASAGEAYLARQVLKTLKTVEMVKVLVTTNTLQGRQILEKPLHASVEQITVAYIPFDRPTLVRKAVRIADPQLLVLFESEIWPGLMSEVLRAGKNILIANGRMTERSFRRYLKIKFVWENLQPHTVLAISEEDKKRFAFLFDQQKSHYVPNIKFDRLKSCRASSRVTTDASFVVFASIRKQEEEAVVFLIEKLLEKAPGCVIGLFPRHMHRLSSWENLLTKQNIQWGLKSHLHNDYGTSKVVLCDTFGELSEAYRRADAAFVGGSLAPLGGQNFIEAFMNGVVPVTGPHVNNFLWAGEEVFSEGLVKKGNTKEEVLELLLGSLAEAMSDSLLQEKAEKYIASKQGGSVTTCKDINGFLARKTSPGNNN